MNLTKQQSCQTNPWTIFPKFVKYVFWWNSFFLWKLYFHDTEALWEHPNSVCKCLGAIFPAWPPFAQTGQHPLSLLGVQLHLKTHCSLLLKLCFPQILVKVSFLFRFFPPPRLWPCKSLYGMEIQVLIQPCSSLPWDKDEREQGEMFSWKASKTSPLLPNIKLLGGKGKGDAQNYQWILDEQGFKFLLTIAFAKEQRIPKVNSPKRGPPTMPKMLSAAWGRKRVCYQVLCKKVEASNMVRKEDFEKEIMRGGGWGG